MNRNLKAMGAVAVAALALSVGASPASAKHHFNTASSPTDLTGLQTTQFTVKTPAGEVKCNTATFSATQGSVNSNELTTTPHYTNCTAFFFTAHASMNGCVYRHTTPTGMLNSTQFTGEPPHIICPAGAQIQITVTVPFAHCTINVPAQTPTSGLVLYQNQGSGNTRHVLFTHAVTGIHFTTTDGPCGEDGTSASLTGSVTYRAYQDGNHAIHEPFQILAT